MNLSNSVAIITGAASGLGYATAQKLIKEKAKVAIFDMSATAKQALVDEFGKQNLLYCALDVTDEGSVDSAISQVLEKWGELHICINCAGIAPAKRVLNKDGQAIPLSEFQNTIHINLIGTFNVARLAASAMSANTPQKEAGERGVIINTASIAGYEGQTGQASYAASKGGILALNLPMARDLAAFGIRVNVIAPGIMATPMVAGMPDKVQSSLVEDIQFPRRPGIPSEFAELCAHIIQNSYLNGEAIRLDGAIRMPAK